MLILTHIKKTYTQQMPNKIKILDEPPVKEFITAEELHNDRKSKFDKELGLSGGRRRRFRSRRGKRKSRTTRRRIPL